MRLLAIDTTTRSGSVALLQSGQPAEVVAAEGPEPYASQLFRDVERLLGNRRLTVAQMDLFAVAAGPGSFTGLRVGLTAVKAWGELFHRAIVPVSALEAVAAQRADGEGRPQTFGAAVVDAHRGQFFAGLYRRNRGELQSIGPEVVLTLEELFADFQSRTAGERFSIVTTSSESEDKLRQYLEREGSDACRWQIEVVSPVLAPHAGRLALARYESGKYVDALHLEARYVRRSDAEILWKGARAGEVARVEDDEGSSATSLLIRPLRAQERTPWHCKRDKVLPGSNAVPQPGRPAGNGTERAWVAERNRAQSGYVVSRTIAGECEILDLGVAPEARRQGVGGLLLDAALESARADGARTAHLEVRESNAAALGLYRRRGFKQIGRRRGYYAQPAEDALLLALQLDSG